MMAVFRFQQRCKSLLKTGSDEDVDADGDPLELAFSRASAGVGCVGLVPGRK
jgi:hypothetical protein